MDWPLCRKQCDLTVDLLCYRQLRICCKIPTSTGTAENTASAAKLTIGWDRTSLRSESPYKLFLRTFPEAYDPANDTAFHSSSSAVSPHLYSYFCAFAFLFFIFFLRHIMIKYFYKEEGITVRDHSESHDQKQNKQRGLYLIRVYK